MREFLAVAKALSDEKRVRVLAMLRGRELCLCQIVAVLDLAPSTVSKHMSILARSGLASVRKDGRWRYFCRAGPRMSRAVRAGLALVDRAIEDRAAPERDARKLEEVLRIPAAEICYRVPPGSARKARRRRSVAAASSRGGSI